MLIRETNHLLQCMTMVALLIALGTSTGADAMAAEETAGINVRLTLSVERYDPVTPGGVLRVEVANKTSEDVTVPVGYGRQTLSVRGQGASHRWPSSLWQRRQQADGTAASVAVLEPGQSRVVFEVPLKDLFSQPDRGKKQWNWDWMARPQSPRSPIHRYRGEGYEDVATFWAELRIAGKSHESDKTTLRIRQGQP